MLRISLIIQEIGNNSLLSVGDAPTNHTSADFMTEVLQNQSNYTRLYDVSYALQYVIEFPRQFFSLKTGTFSYDWQNFACNETLNIRILYEVKKCVNSYLY